MKTKVFQFRKRKLTETVNVANMIMKPISKYTRKKPLVGEETHATAFDRI